jgi:hypothetical protein
MDRPEKLEHVVYMVPYDVPQFVHPACSKHHELLTTRGSEKLVVVHAARYASVEVVDSKLMCHIRP